MGASGLARSRLLRAAVALAAILVTFAVRAGPPGFPVEAEELMEERGAFKGERERAGNWTTGDTSNFH